MKHKHKVFTPKKKGKNFTFNYDLKKRRALKDVT